MLRTKQRGAHGFVRKPYISGVQEQRQVAATVIDISLFAVKTM